MKRERGKSQKKKSLKKWTRTSKRQLKTEQEKIQKLPIEKERKIRKYSIHKNKKSKRENLLLFYYFINFMCF